MIQERLSSHWLVRSDMEGLRADTYLQRMLGCISRARAQRIIKAQDFLLDGQEVKFSKRVKEGQKATLMRFAPDTYDLLNNISMQVIFQDQQLIVVNKVDGISIHPSANCLYKTLTHWLR